MALWKRDANQAKMKYRADEDRTLLLFALGLQLLDDKPSLQYCTEIASQIGGTDEFIISPAGTC